MQFGLTGRLTLPDCKPNNSIYEYSKVRPLASPYSLRVQPFMTNNVTIK